MYSNVDMGSINFDLFDDLPKEFIPLSPIGPPDRNNFEGIYKFVVEIDGSHTQKKKYLYSHRLNRIYVNMECDFSVNFKWERNPEDEPLYVRATTVFSELSQAQKRVERCYQHSHESFNSGHDASAQHVIKNVLRSSRAGGGDVFYCGCARDADSWYSVLLRLAAPAAHAFRFVCKNSCASGINRRPIDVIFTLEDFAGRVLGRQSVGARVCSCPRRDMVNDEKQPLAGKRALPAPPAAPAPPSPAAPTNPAPPPTKRRMREVTDEDVVITLPSMQVIGSRTAMTGINVMLNMMKQSRAIKISAKQPVDDYNKCINELKNLADNINPDTTK